MSFTGDRITCTCSERDARRWLDKITADALDGDADCAAELGDVLGHWLRIRAVAA